MSRLIRFARFVKGQQGLSPSKVVSFFYHLPNLLRLIARLLRDPRVPRRLKGYCAAALLYLLMPFDIIPEFLLPLFGIGVADDITFLFIAFHKLIKDSPQHVVDEHVQSISRKTRPQPVEE